MRIVDNPYYYLILNLSHIRNELNKSPKSKKSSFANRELSEIINLYGNHVLAELEPSEWLM